jgi:hypothetical protein
MENIFSSAFKLTYLRKDIEEEYIRKKEDAILKNFKFVSVPLLILSLSGSIEISFFFSLWDKVEFRVVMFSSYIVSILCFAFCLYGILLKNKRVLKIINFLNYYILLYIFVNIRIPLVIFMKTDWKVYFFLITLEIFVRMLWIMLQLNNFFEFFIVNCMIVISVWSVYGIHPEVNNIHQYLSLANSISLSILLVFAYFLEKSHKKAFYYNYLNEQKAEWLQNVLDNMKTGYMSIQGENISYINNYLEQIFNNWNAIEFSTDNVSSHESKNIY